VLLLVVALLVLWGLQRDRALPGVTLAGLDVGGQDAGEIRETIAPVVQARESDAVTLTFGDERFELVPQDIGYAVDVDASVEAALSIGREGLPGDVTTRLRAYRTTTQVELVERTERADIVDAVDAIADDLDREERDAAVTVDPDSIEVERVLSLGAIEVRRDEAVELVERAIVSPGPDELALPVDTTPQPVADEDVDEVAAQVERALAEELVLEASGESLTLVPSDLARLVEVRAAEGGTTGRTLELVVTEERVEDVLGEVARGRFDVAPQDASFESSRTPPSTFDDQGTTTFRPLEASVTVVEGREGARFDAGTAASQLTELLRDGARSAQVRLETVEAELSTERARGLQPTHVIGTFTTYYQAGQTRNTNIQLLADTVDGAVVLPGEQFSINNISGERTCEKGYEPAGTIIRGELVDTCGGGVSQFGTTTFNAAFFAGVQLDQWRAHSWYISRYPMGREATLSYPELDVRFTNTTDGAIIVRASHTDTSVTVTLLGRPIAAEVTATHGSPTDPREFGTETRSTSELFQGQERVLQDGLDGFTVEVRRDVVRPNGDNASQTITTVYVPQTRIIERGTRPRSSPPPPPDAEDEEDADDDEGEDEDDED
jgi:vancomycin resistance protein YoaR